MVRLLGNKLDNMQVDEAEYIILLARECTEWTELCTLLQRLLMYHATTNSLLHLTKPC